MKPDVTMSTKSKMGPTIGVFVSLFGDYQDAIWNGIAQVAKEHHANVMCFVGAALNDRAGFQKHWNAIYDLADPANLDGLIMLSSALQNYVTIEELSQFFARYAPLPAISIGQKLEGIPSITTDNTVGMRNLMKHLVERHHYRRIAFIRGPENNPDAETRYRIYADALKSYNIPFEPDLIASGDFLDNSGAEAVRLFLDRRKIDFEVIVASNDYMAIGAWQELAIRGYSIPTDVAVTGFDDIPEAQVYTRPLTTVRQSLTEQGRQAMRMLLEYLQQGSPPENSILDTEMVIRESCGCLAPTVSDLTFSSLATSASASKKALARQRDAALADIQELICPYFTDISPQAIEAMVDAFFDALQGRSSSFLPLLSHLLREGVTSLSYTTLQTGIMSRWQEALWTLREKALPYKLTMDVERLLYQGSILITEAAEYAHLSWQARVRTSVEAQDAIIRDINAASNIQQITDVLAQNLLTLDVRDCFLALYQEGPIPSPLSQLIMAFRDGKRVELEPGGRIFPSKEIIPSSVLSDHPIPLLMIRPLVMRDIQFGFITMAMNAERWTRFANTYMGFPEQIGLALYRVLLQQRIEQSNKNLRQHAAELAEANTQLEQFAYIASHDLQEPLRMVALYLQLLKRRYQDKLDTDAQEFIAFAIDGAMRMKRMIKGLMAYSWITMSDQPAGPTDCEQLLAQTLSRLGTILRDNDVLVTHDPLPIVLADGAQLVEVFHNLIENAIKFHADRQPRIHISAEYRAEEWVFSIRDNGIGIEPEYYERIFAVFSHLHTQAQYPGAGIGLAICKKIVEHHGGHIWVESQLGEGATFFFSLPVTPSQPG